MAPTASVLTRSSSSLVDEIRLGIPTSTLEHLATVLGVRVEDLASTVRIPARTLARRRQSGTMSMDESERIVRVARMIDAATAALGSLDAARIWLNAQNVGLANVTPMSLLDTEVGGEMVRNLLGQIEHGVFA